MKKCPNCRGTGYVDFESAGRVDSVPCPDCSGLESRLVDDFRTAIGLDPFIPADRCHKVDEILRATIPGDYLLGCDWAVVLRSAITNEVNVLQNRIRELEGKVVETPAHWTKIIEENKTLRAERDHYMREMYRAIGELRKLRATI